MAIGGSAAGPPADVIHSGTDEQRPPRRGLRATAAVALAGAVLLGLLLSEDRDDAPAGGAHPAPVQQDLRLVETGGAPSLWWGYGGRLDISLPVMIHNDGPDLTVASLALDGTALEQPAVDVALRHGGRLPLTLRQSMSCPDGTSVPANATLRLETERDGDASTRWLPLPDEAAQALAAALAEQCRSVPLEQSLVVTAEEVGVQDTGVVLRVVAESIAAHPLQVVSLDPASGLGITLTPEAQAVTLPHPLQDDPVVLRLAVDLRDCGALALVDRLDTAGVADVAYTDPSGRRAAKAVVGDFPRLRELVERTC